MEKILFTPEGEEPVEFYVYSLSLLKESKNFILAYYRL